MSECVCTFSTSPIASDNLRLQHESAAYASVSARVVYMRVCVRVCMYETLRFFVVHKVFLCLYTRTSLFVTI